MLITERPQRLQALDAIAKRNQHPHRRKLKSTSIALFTVAALSTTAMATAKASTYTVKSGDTLSKIAHDEHIDLNQLTHSNSVDPNNLQIGQTLNIPDGQTTNATYTIQTGDTLSAIAEKQGMDLNTLEQLNGLNDNSILQVGQVLQLQSNGNTNQTNNPSNVSATTNNQATTLDNNQANTTNPTATSSTPVQTTSASSTPVATAVPTTTAPTATNSAGTNNADNDSKAWIASHESGGSYTAQNGQYVGKYQLSASYLHGDYSASNQEKTADQYVTARYGSWDNAKTFWQNHGWY